MENSPEIRPVVIMGMNEVMKEMIDPEVYEMFGIPDDAEETMYVATVPDKNSGAGVIAYQDFMDQAAERVALLRRLRRQDVCPPHQQRQAHFSIYLLTVHQSSLRNALQDPAPYQ